MVTKDFFFILPLQIFKDPSLTCTRKKSEAPNAALEIHTHTHLKFKSLRLIPKKLGADQIAERNHEIHASKSKFGYLFAGSRFYRMQIIT